MVQGERDGPRKSEGGNHEKHETHEKKKGWAMGRGSTRRGEGMCNWRQKDPYPGPPQNPTMGSFYDYGGMSVVFGEGGTRGRGGRA